MRLLKLKHNRPMQTAIKIIRVGVRVLSSMSEVFASGIENLEMLVLLINVKNLMGGNNRIISLILSNCGVKSETAVTTMNMNVTF